MVVKTNSTSWPTFTMDEMRAIVDEAHRERHKVASHAMALGGLGSDPGAGGTWTGRLWPIAERRGYGYAVSYRTGPDAGSIWAYGGEEPLHRVWDSVVDLLVELYQALTTGEPFDAAVAAAANGRVVWTNLS